MDTMRVIGGMMRGTALAALALSVPLAPVAAQSVGDFQLRPGSSSPTPRPAGPSDPEAPVIASPRAPAPRPTAQPTNTPAPSATPSIAPAPVTGSPSAGPRPQVRPGQQVPRPTAGLPPVGPTVSPAGATPSATPDPLSANFPGGAIPTASQSAAPVSGTQPALTSEPGFDWLSLLPWLGGALAAVLIALGGLWWSRRRESAPPVIDFERPVVAAPEPAATPAAGPEPSAEPELGELVLGTEQVLEADVGPLGLSLSATRLSASLLNTTLAYKIELTNHADVAVGPLTIAGDMIAAHASLPVERQLGLDGANLEKRHELASLAPGESATLTGEIRLPLAMITPIRAGAAAFFVPLARFRIEAVRKGAETLRLARTFVVGETPEKAGAALRPFRLDLGPRVYSHIGQREVAQPA